MTDIVFVHGWGFDAGAWGGVREGLADFECDAVDLGFFGRPSRFPENGGDPVVAVGHSLGFLWLLRERPFPWRALVSIAGMPRFTRGPGYDCGMAGRVLDAMIARLAVAPAETLADFLARCGCPPRSANGGLDGARLAEALRWLREWDARETLAEEPAPVLALFAEDDEIVRKEMSEAAFAARPNTALVRRRDGGHALPLTRAEWCADRIRKFVRCLP